MKKVPIDHCIYHLFQTKKVSKDLIDKLTILLMYKKDKKIFATKIGDKWYEGYDEDSHINIIIDFKTIEMYALDYKFIANHKPETKYDWMRE